MNKDKNPSTVRIPCNVPHKNAPYINVEVSIPHHRGGITNEGKEEATHTVTFLLDTGSSYTILSPKDASLLKVNTEGSLYTIKTIDGSAKLQCVRVLAKLKFETDPSNEEKRFVETEVNIYGATGFDSDWGEYPSILGRDMLKRFSIKLEPPSKKETWRYWLNVLPEEREGFTPCS